MGGRAQRRWPPAALALLALAVLLAPPFAAPLGVGAGGFRGVAELVYGKDGDLWLVRADGSERRPLTIRRNPQVVAVPVSWSPDGRWLAHTLQPVPAYPGDQRLLLLDVLTGAERTVAARTFEPQLAWSADGRRLYVEGVVDPAGSTGGTPLHVYDLALSRLSPIDVPHAGTPASPRAPASPTSRRAPSGWPTPRSMAICACGICLATASALWVSRRTTASSASPSRGRPTHAGSPGRGRARISARSWTRAHGPIPRETCTRSASTPPTWPTQSCSAPSRAA